MEGLDCSIPIQGRQSIGVSFADQVRDQQGQGGQCIRPAAAQTAKHEEVTLKPMKCNGDRPLTGRELTSNQAGGFEACQLTR
jgi:hypothetical protein